MSKKSEKQSKVFISFGDVAGGFKPVSSAAGLPSSMSTPLPLYGGNDSELVILSKKLMKKDGVTKIKAIQDLVGVLNTKPEATLAEFLVFYVYAFSKLYLEDHRVIREKLCFILLTIVRVERRLLAPHMKTLIGPWWMLTGDPVGDVAATAYESFCAAIPPKKRQLVLVYLSGSILSEAVKNVQLRPETLCDLSLTPMDEAEERLERVMVSTLASIEKFVMTLTADQNLQLARGTAEVGVESFGETVVTYKDLFTQAMWAKCLESKFVLVRRATYQLIATLALHAPEVLTTRDISNKSSIAFFKLFLNCLLVETNVLNLHVLLNAFVTVTTSIPALFEIASVTEDIVPVLLHLLQTNAPFALEYVLPISGSLPPEQVALLEPTSADPAAALKQSQSQQSMCGFLQQLFDFAEQKAAEGGVQGLRAELGSSKVRSGRRNAAEKMNVHKMLQQQSLRAECVVLGMQTDVCAVELATLLLLRRSTSFSTTTSTLGENQISDNVQAVVSQLVQSIIITVQSATIALRGETTKGNLFQKAVEASVSDEVISPGSAQVKETARSALAAIGRSLLQLHRAALMEMHISSAQWTQLLWEPLSEGLLDLYLVTTASPTASPTSIDEKVTEGDAEGEGEGDQMAMMLSVTSLLNCILQTVSSAWSEGVSPAMATFQGGASAIALKFVNFATTELRAGRSGMAAASNSVLLSQLVMTLSDPSVGLAGSVVPLPEVLKLLSAEWVDVLIAAIASGPASSSVHTNYVLSAGLFDIVAFIVELGGAEAARVVLSRCVKSNSIEAVCIVCKAAGAITLAWGTDALEWATNTGLKFLQADSPRVSLAEMKLQVRFLLLICAQPTCAPVSAAWFVVAKTLWLTPRSNKLSDWFILSLIAVVLKQSQNQRLAASNRLLLPPDLHTAVMNRLTEHREGLSDSLQKLFFGRLRASVHTPKGPAHHEVLILKDVNVVMNWADVVKLLLPNLTPQMRLGFYGAVASTLNSTLTTTATSGDEQEAENADCDTEESAAVTTGLQPKKWSRHVCGLLSAQQSTAALEGIKLFTVAFWETTLQSCLADSAPQKTLSFALACLGHILSGDAVGEDGQIGSQLVHSHLFSHPALVFSIIMAVKLSLRVVTPAEKTTLEATEQQLLSLFATTSTDLRAPFFTERLATIRDATITNDKLRALQVDALKTLLAKEFYAKFTSREPLRLSSPGIRPAERPALGSPGQYLSWKALPVSDAVQSHGVSSAICADAALLTRIAPIACKLAAVHREAGADPYFTITMDQTGDADVAHELQVEWPKVILGRNLPSSHVDLIWNYQTTSSLGARGHTPRKFDSPTLEACVAWLESSLDLIVQEVVACSAESNDSTSVLFRQCSLYADVFVAASAHLLDEPASVRERFEVRVVAHLRGIAAHLLSPRCTLPTYAARCTGLLLMQALLRADLGTGAGLWLPVVLSNVRVVAASVVAASLPLDALQHANLLALIVATLAHILSVVSHSEVCLDCAETVLSAALAALPSPSTELASNLLHLLAAVWRHRSDTRDVKAEVPVLGDVAVWETEGFDFSVFVLVEGLTGHSLEARVDACRAVHFCLLKRSRRSCRDLMGPSLVSRFAEQLQGIAVCDPASSSSPLSSLQISDPAVSNTLRVTSCKILDAFEASKSDTTNTASSSSSSSAKDEDALAADDISLQEQERIDLEKDGVFLGELIGAVYSSELSRRLVIAESSISRNISTESLAADDGDEDAEDGCTTPISSSVASGSSAGRKLSKRATLDFLSKKDPLGTVLLWLLLLQSIDARAVEGWSVRARCVNYLKNSGMSSNVLHLLIRLGGDLLKFRDVSALLQRVETVGSLEIEEEVTEGRPRKNNDQANQNTVGNIPVGSLQHLAIYALFRTVCTLPAMFRTFYNDDCTRVQKTRLSKFVEDRVRESLMKREVSLIAASSAAGRWNANEFSVRGSVVSGEVTAVLSKDETSVEIKVKLPASYPLKIVEVSCTSRIGVSDGRWRRWVLQIIQLLGMQDGSVVDAVLMWKCNIEKELEGVEPCPICYCTLHTKTLCLPSMACPTCNNKFHSPCLNTWFKSSGKSKCVICQQPFFN